MKINVGCGDDVRDGWVNVDIRATRPSVIVHDLSRFPWPFSDNSADEMLLSDFLEHFPYADTDRILLECYRVLKTGGIVTIQVPDAVHTARALIQEGEYLCNRCGGAMSDYERDSCEQCGQTRDEISQAAMQRLYGGQNYSGNFHYTCFTQRSLVQKSEKSGLNYHSLSDDADHLVKNWTIGIKFFKGDLWK